MQQYNRINEKTFLNTIKETIAYNLQNIPNISSGLCRHKFYDINICDVLRDLVPFAQFKKRVKHPWRSVTFSKV